jgi:hypothetical protein
MQYCQSCHAFPNPALLASKTWEKGVLPAMGPRLGIFRHNNIQYPSSVNDMSLSAGYYPQTSVITREQWQKIINYYIASAPDTLIIDKTIDKPIDTNLVTFTVHTPDITYPHPATGMVKINNTKEKVLFISDAVTSNLYRFNKTLQVSDSFKSDGVIVDVEAVDDNFMICDIGILNPNNLKYGKGRTLTIDKTGLISKKSEILFQGLSRPVQISAADLNADGRQDYLVCEFGFQTGALSWMENQGNGNFKRNVLKAVPGATKAYIDDYNKDGLPDLCVLFAQGDENISFFINKGYGQFEQKRLLQFSPVNGSTYFELVDFNKDGFNDIIYTCGDNADYSTILKPYHGVYIYINDGKNNFKQQYFFHINGCFKAIARDYDNDGDIDIATISFFADYLHKPEEGFVYLENKGNMIFSPYSAIETKVGRWLTMDAGDINNDGKIDLILGNFSVGPVMIKARSDWKKAPPFIVLQNTGTKHF